MVVVMQAFVDCVVHVQNRVRRKQVDAKSQNLLRSFAITKAKKANKDAIPPTIVMPNQRSVNESMSGSDGFLRSM